MPTHLLLRRDSHLKAWCRCWPGCRLDSTHALSKLGSRALKRTTRRKAPATPPSPPKPSMQKHLERGPNNLRVLWQAVHLFLQWLKILTHLRFGLNSHFELRKHLSVVQTNKTPILSPSPLISAHLDKA